MATVKLKINNSFYDMQCDDGQEEHLSYLGYELNKRIERIVSDTKQMPDNRLFFLSSLLLLDEIVSLQDKVEAYQKDVQTDTSHNHSTDHDNVVEAIHGFANKIEALTKKNREIIEDADHQII